MGVFQGEKLSLGEMLQQTLAEPAQDLRSTVGVLHTAASNARDCTNLIGDEGGLVDAWRFGILQTLDDYTSTLSRGGPEVASGVFTEEPPPTGAAQVDAAFAALAEHLAIRDGWRAPEWTEATGRFLTVPWFPAVPARFRDEAETESPPAFRRRSIFITDRSLARA